MINPGLTRRRLLSLLPAGGLAACAAQPAPTSTQPRAVFRSAARYERVYKIQPGDQIQVTVFHMPELSTTTVVRPDGNASLPLLQDVKLGGLAVPDAAKNIEKLYAPRVNRPDVQLNLLSLRPPSVYVLGEVPRPGPVALREAPTMATALAAAGGTTRTASLEAVALVRLEDDGTLTGTVITPADFGETAFYQATAAVPLQAGDLVIVPESGRSQFVRFIQDYINTPLSAPQSALTVANQFQTLRLISNYIGISTQTLGVSVTK